MGWQVNEQIDVVQGTSSGKFLHDVVNECSKSLTFYQELIGKDFEGDAAPLGLRFCALSRGGACRDGHAALVWRLVRGADGVACRTDQQQLQVLGAHHQHEVGVAVRLRAARLIAQWRLSGIAWRAY